MIILKLGGGLLTDKEEEFSLKEDVLERVAGEIKEGARGEIIIVHGGGSFGHPLAKRYALQDGFKDERQLEGVVRTRAAMEEFNRAVVDALLGAGLRAVGLQPSACITCRGREIDRFETAGLEGFLKLGIIPVLYGDVVVDDKLGFCILSGDRIIARLAGVLGPERIILGVDVDGVFTGDPKRGEGSLVEEVNPGNLPHLLDNLGALDNDVTGGMKGKVLELAALAHEGHGSQIVNAAVPGRLKKALLGEAVKGTWIAPGNYEGVF
ncbi:MAG: isopentenyl phosphate kinase family protein [Euryarchaeota archaeon]|nr:isopentenyl phosphate kinase family protein [Euryarchaeota archaeon]